MTEKEYRQKLRDQEAAKRRARGEPAPEKSYDAPLPSNLTSRQKLDIANSNFHLRGDGHVEQPLTDDERGMSETAFSRLPGKRKLDIANQAMLTRRGVP